VLVVERSSSTSGFLTDERPIIGWVSSLGAGRNSIMMAFTDNK